MKPTPPPDNPFVSLLVNILIPVMVLHKGGALVGPRVALLVALCFPLVYGVQDYARRRHKNYVSLVGLVNIMLTGGLALASLNGIWFAFKDASLPCVLGLLVFGSAWTAKPAAQMIFCNPHVLNMTLIEERVAQLSKAVPFGLLLRKTTLWLSLSFFISSVANFFLAMHIFKDIDAALPKDEQMKVLNGQLAHMTGLGFAMIALPLMVFSGILIYAFLNKLSRLIEVPVESLMKS